MTFMDVIKKIDVIKKKPKCVNLKRHDVKKKYRVLIRKHLGAIRVATPVDVENADELKQALKKKI